MTFGVTEDGFIRKRFEDIESELKADLRRLISAKLTLDEKTVLGNLVKTFADHLAELWEDAEEAWHAFDPDNATDNRLVALAALRGTTRRPATKGVVTCTCNFDASKEYAPGDLVAHVVGSPTNRWVNRDAVTTTTAGNYSVVFESETAGAHATASAGTLTVIAQPIDGWNSVTNAAEATPGQDIESVDALWERSEAELAQAGSGTLAAIRAAVSAVDGVLQVVAQENRTAAVAGGIPPHAFRIVVWDGVSPAADNDEIAQAILDNAPAGIESTGSASGTAKDEAGESRTVNFERATQVPIYVKVTCTGDFDEDEVKAAIVAAGQRGVGDDVVALRVRAAPLGVTGVTDVTDFAIGTAENPSSDANIPITDVQIALFDASRVTVTAA